ncbi:MAG TPA: helix-turn-helix domain-containing protein [Thermoanaerobaculia bacterium]|nr:helix-turn-helix domain-containing protein [Thermoanaerobaculia bacterium]
MMTSEDPTLTHQQVLDLVGVHRDTLWRWRNEGFFPHPIRRNRRGDLGWKKSAVEDWLRRRDHGEAWH